MLIPLAVFGVLGLATVVFVHELAEVLVILNAIRVARARALPGITTAVTATPLVLSLAVVGGTQQDVSGCCDVC